ncbi:DUF3324 domain-containing protein [Latilactobacillus sakei]|uniref:DUF3324 domain-containing protein n=1 Tax=Latilactobacillus sakei TaxID=1599 RepID=UPI0020C821F7|nr:DUF3324 domain-containing protein [Latilactobacillus sakei]MCP8855262.1 DUF3324 domain-containing protein [Latilactobacillus sakei]
MRTTIKRLVIGLLFGLIALFAHAQATQAAQPVADFAMTIIPPDNQADKQLSYFDLVVQPKQQQDLQIKLVNHKDKPIKVRVQTNTATTNVNGVVNYSDNVNQSDKTLKYPLGKHLKPAKKNITLTAHEQKVVNIRLSAPDKAFKGQLVGGISATEVPTTAKTTQQISVRNKFAYAVAVVARSNDQSVTPEFKLGAVKTGQHMGTNQIIANIRNVQPKFQNQTSLNAFVTKRNQKTKLYQTEKKQVQFAPNSVMQFYLPLNDRFKPGRYTLDLTVRSEGRTWHFTRHFTISRQAAAKWNQKDVSLTPETDYWPYILAGLTLILLILAYVYWRYRKKQKENQALKDEIDRLKS